MRKYLDKEYAGAEFSVRSSILEGIAKTAHLHSIQYNEHSKAMLDEIADAVFTSLTFQPKLWALLALAEKGGVPKAMDMTDRSILICNVCQERRAFRDKAGEPEFAERFRGKQCFNPECKAVGNFRKESYRGITETLTMLDDEAEAT